MKAILFGATGMVGIEVLHQCLDHPEIEHITTVGRRKTGVEHPKLTELEHDDFEYYATLTPELAEASICFYCLGVYQGMVSDDVYWRITVDYLEALVRTCERVNPDMTFCLFGAKGADPSEKSRLLFARAKGRADQILLDSKIARKYTFRPGYIDPGRQSAKSRIPWWVGRPFFLLFPSIGISAEDLASVMVDVGVYGHGHPILENREMRELAR